MWLHGTSLHGQQIGQMSLAQYRKLLGIRVILILHRSGKAHITISSEVNIRKELRDLKEGVRAFAKENGRPEGRPHVEA